MLIITYFSFFAVLGTIGCVLSTLALMFWVYFMYLWRTWDSGKRDSSNSGGGPSQVVQFCEDGTTLSKRKSLGSCASDDNDIANVDDYENDPSETGSAIDDASGTHPHFDRALRRSRRKSVSFAVCKVNKDTMQFEIENKSVFLGKQKQCVSYL